MTLESGEECLASILYTRIRRKCQRRDLTAALDRQQPHATNEREPIFSGHGDVADQKIGLHAFDEIERLAGRCRCSDGDPVALQDEPQCLTRVFLVFDEKDAESRRRSFLGRGGETGKPRDVVRRLGDGEVDDERRTATPPGLSALTHPP